MPRVKAIHERADGRRGASGWISASIALGVGWGEGGEGLVDGGVDALDVVDALLEYWSVTVAARSRSFTRSFCSFHI